MVMPPLDKLLAGHSLLIDLIAAEAAICAVETMPDPAEPLLRARRAIARALMEQITFEETHVLAPLDATRDPASQALATMIRTEQTAFTETMYAHAYRWPVEAVASDWQGFRRAMATSHDQIAAQIRWEISVVAPAIARLGGASATPTKNWARDVWDIKDALTGG